MPKTMTPRVRNADTSYYSEDVVMDPATGSRKYTPNDELRNSVGDQGAAKVKAGRSTIPRADDKASSSDAQDTPTQRRIRLKKAMDDENDELVGKVKSAMTKRGGPLVQSNYE